MEKLRFSMSISFFTKNKEEIATSCFAGIPMTFSNGFLDYAPHAFLPLLSQG
jgi:hypothetical protein